MNAKNAHAVALGRKGGRTTSPAKAKAARANGKLGGRPRTMPVLMVARGTALKHLVVFDNASGTGRALCGVKWEWQWIPGAWSDCTCGRCNMAAEDLAAAR